MASGYFALDAERYLVAGAARIAELDKRIKRNENRTEKRGKCPECGTPTARGGLCPDCHDTIKWAAQCAKRRAESKARREAYMREYGKAYYSRFKGAKPGTSPRAAAQHEYYIARKLREAGVKP